MKARKLSVKTASVPQKKDYYEEFIDLRDENVQSVLFDEKIDYAQPDKRVVRLACAYEGIPLSDNLEEMLGKLEEATKLSGGELVPELLVFKARIAMLILLGLNLDNLVVAKTDWHWTFFGEGPFKKGTTLRNNLKTLIALGEKARSESDVQGIPQAIQRREVG